MRRAMEKRLALVVAWVAAALPAQPPQASPIATGTLVVRGRCVDADTGAPLPRCRVRFTGHESTGYPIACERADWADPAEVTTGADGAFRFEVRLPADYAELDRGRYHLQISHPHHAGWFSHCAFVIACAQGGVDYGDVRLQKGVWPRLRCEDANGAPQPGVLLYLRRSKGPDGDAGFAFRDGDGPHWWTEAYAYARTDVDGGLHLDNPLPAGPYALEVRGREASKVPDKIELPRADAIVAVVEPLDEADSILGRLVDASGSPVEGAWLSDGIDSSTTSCFTRRDGAFTLVRPKAERRATAKLHLAQNQRFDGWVPLGEIEWGSRAVELVVPAKTLHTFVVRTAHGAAVEDFNLYCRRRAEDVPNTFRLAGTFAGGRSSCRLPPGDYELLVAPRSDRTVATGWQPITVDSAKEEIVVVVPEAVARTMEIHFADDRAAAAGVLVEAILGGEPTPFAWVRPATLVDVPGKRHPELRVVASARTDANGRTTLQLAQAGKVHLRVSGPGVQNAVLSVDLTDGKDPLPVVAERGATLLGSLGPLAALRALDPEFMPEAKASIYSYHSRSLPTLTIVGADGKERREGIRIDHQGRFRCDGLPPGPVELRLGHFERVKEGSRPAAKSVVLGKCTLRVDAPQSVELQLPAGAGTGR